MRIAYITAGAAGMYCGSCMHDNTLAAALQRRGHDVALIPTYTPVRTDEDDVSIDRVFYGAVNVYLEQRWRPFRRAPGFVHWLLDRPALLKLASRMAGTNAVDGGELGALTLSVLRGEEGKQRGELERLVQWLRDEYRPEVVHLTNSMFLGMARSLKRELGVPVVCSVQGEDLFLNQMIEPWRGRVHEEMRAHAADVDAFVAPSRYYAGVMGEYLGVAPASMRVVPLGIVLEGHGVAAPDPDGVFRIGYLARLCPDKGLHLLAEAFRRLAEIVGRDRVRLRVAGYLGKADVAYANNVRERLVSWGLGDRVEFLGELDRAAKLDLLHGIDVLSVPTVYRESKGLPVLEALASGVPVVQPRHGGFPEMLEATGGGLLVEPDSPEAVAAGLLELMQEPDRRRELGERGRSSVHELFSDDAMAAATLAVYEDLTARHPATHGQAAAPSAVRV